MEELKELLSHIDEMAERCKMQDLPNNLLAEGYNGGVETFAIWVKRRIDLMIWEKENQ